MSAQEFEFGLDTFIPVTVDTLGDRSAGTR